MLENSPEWAGVLAYNEFTGGYRLILQSPFRHPIIAEIRPGEIEDHFDTGLVRWLERKGGVMAKPDMVRRVVDGWARPQPVSPNPSNTSNRFRHGDGVRRI